MKTKKLITQFPHEILAVDEVGRGPLGGPVVVGCVRVVVKDQTEYFDLLKFLKKKSINDSKKISASQRESILNNMGIDLLDYRKSGKIATNGPDLTFITWEMDHEVIDNENILAASLRAMKEAALALSQMKKYPSTLLIDGNKKLRWVNQESPFTEIPLVQGDSKSLLIGLASIMAKQKRDSYMLEMHELYPEYGFNQNAGYPTQSHREAIKTFGPSPIHRKTFKGVKEFIRS